MQDAPPGGDGQRDASTRSLADTVAAARSRLETTFLGRYLELLLDLRIVDRSLALASKLFIAILPLSILSSSLVSNESFGDEVVDRFGLEGTAAHAARLLFASPSQVQSGIGLLGVIILVSSVLSFARALEAVYLDCWQLPPSPLGAIKRRLTWLAGFAAYGIVLSPLRDVIDRPLAARIVAAVLAAALFLWTPYVLLGRRVPWQRLAPTGAITGAAMLVFGLGSAITLPRQMAHNTDRYGLIGFTFSLVSWLFVAAAVVVAAAALGALIDRQRRRVPDVNDKEE